MSCDSGYRTPENQSIPSHFTQPTNDLHKLYEPIRGIVGFYVLGKFLYVLIYCRGRENAVDKILIFECSRLSRRAADFLNIIEELNELGISLHILQNGLETLLPDGKVNPIASLVLGILAQFNSMERTLIRSRMEAGYENYRGKGGVVGRKVGYKKSDMQMIADYPEEIRLIRKDYSLRNISKITNTSVNTIMKLKRIVC